MSDWSAGYMADINYTYGYYPELNPLRIRQAFLDAGLVFPEAGHACELGFGQGMSTNIHAAASATQWHGTDFNPSQAGFAQDLAATAGTGAMLQDAAFADFANRGDLPDLDFIGLHGIWSWISDENRAVIVDFVQRKLKVGGVLYISYNTQPGWAGFAPMRRLLAEHATTLGAPGQGIEHRVEAAVDFASRLLEAKPAYARTYPQLAERLKKIKEQNRSYLAHEYFHDHWQPMHFTDMARWLGPAKMNFAVSANFTDHVDALNLTPAQLDFLKEIPEPGFRESVRDFMVNQQFRRDYWVKGARRLGPARRGDLQGTQRIVLVAPRGDVPMQISAGLGKVTLSEEIYAPLLDALADHRPRALADLGPELKAKKVAPGQLLQAIQVLTGMGVVAPVQDEAAIEAARPRTQRLNAALMELARENGEIGTLASPVTGGGIQVARFVQLFLRARQSGLKTPEEWAQATWKTLAGQGERLVKEGKPLATPADNLAELTQLATKFADKRMRVLEALQVA